MWNLFFWLSLFHGNNYDSLKYVILQNTSAHFLSRGSHTPREWEQKIIEMLKYSRSNSSSHRFFFLEFPCIVQRRGNKCLANFVWIGGCIVAELKRSWQWETRQMVMKTTTQTTVPRAGFIWIQTVLQIGNCRSYMTDWTQTILVMDNYCRQNHYQLQKETRVKCAQRAA